jgi:hypothetical protein
MAVFGEILLSGDRGNPEWQRSAEVLGLILLASGLRSEDFDLPDRNKVNLIMHNAATEPPPVAPNAQEVLAMDAAQADNAGLQRHREPAPERLWERRPKASTVPDYKVLPWSTQ